MVLSTIKSSKYFPLATGAVSGNANNTTGYTWRKVAKLLPPFTTQEDVQLQLAA